MKGFSAVTEFLDDRSDMLNVAPIECFGSGLRVKKIAVDEIELQGKLNAFAPLLRKFVAKGVNLNLICATVVGRVKKATPLYAVKAVAKVKATSV